MEFCLQIQNVKNAAIFTCLYKVSHTEETVDSGSHYTETHNQQILKDIYERKPNLGFYIKLLKILSNYI